MSDFDRTTLRAIRADLDKAFAEIGAKHGISLGIGTMRYSANQFTASLKAANLAPSTTDAETPEGMTAIAGDAPFGVNHRWTRAFLQYHAQIGLKAEDLGKAIPYNGKQMRIGGITTNSPRGVVILATMDPKPKYTVVPLDVVTKGLGR